MALRTARTVTPTSAKTAIHMVARPRAASTSTATLMPTAKPDVLPGDAEGAAGDADGGGNLGGLVVHEHHVGGLDGGVGAQGAHGDAHIGPGEDGGVVDAVAHEGQRAPAAGAPPPGHLVGREEAGRGTRPLAGPLATAAATLSWSPVSRTVSADAGGFEGFQGFGGIGLDAVADDDVAGVDAVDGYMDDGAAVMAGMPGGAFFSISLALPTATFLPFTVAMMPCPAVSSTLPMVQASCSRG